MNQTQLLINHQENFWLQICLDIKSYLTTRLTSFLTVGETSRTVGNATRNAKLHALIQIFTMFSTNPTLNTLITNDMMHDINSAIKKAKTKCWYFLFITSVTFQIFNKKTERLLIISPSIFYFRNSLIFLAITSPSSSSAK